MLKYNKQYKRVHIVVPNKSLLQRDMVDYADYYRDIAQDKIVYHE
jgi:hypothetical protein